MSYMSELDIEIREAIESGCDWHEIVRLYESKVGFDNLADLWDEYHGGEPENDGQPTEYEEWQDYMGGDDWDHGQYDNEY